MARADDDPYTRHIATPTGLDFARAAALYGLVHEPVDTIPGFRSALERALSPQSPSTLIHIRTERNSAERGPCTPAYGAPSHAA